MSFVFLRLVGRESRCKLCTREKRGHQCTRTIGCWMDRMNREEEKIDTEKVAKEKKGKWGRSSL